MKVRRKCVLFLFLAMAGRVMCQNLTVYDVPPELKYSAHNDDFTVQVREMDGEWMDLFEYNVKVDLDKLQNASMVTFDCAGIIEVRCRKNNGLIEDVKIRPSALMIKPEIAGNTFSFFIEKPCQLSVEINGDRLHNLHVFANPILKNCPDINDDNVIYFGPGFHQPGDLPGDVFHIPGGKTVYIHGGAVVKAKFFIDKAKDVKIVGHGIVWQPERGVEIRHSKNVYIEGPIFINPSHYTIYGGQVNGLVIKDIKTFSSRGWADGIDLMSCSNVKIDNVFLRTSDDCIAIYGHRWDFYGSSRDIKVRNAILWADVAHPTNIGLHGNAAAGGDTIENILFENIDILEHDEDDANYQGCLAISNADNNLVRNITYADIRIEQVQEGALFNFRSVYNKKYSGAPGRNIENIVLKNISYTGGFINASVVGGYSNDRIVKGLRFENVLVNKEAFSMKNKSHVVVNEFVSDVETVK
ncbi:glycosyl hydrolase family 28 protein [Geofilum sp. OHC36d9]|uniref:glycosyl hydrolase family 28 protein n=1 Tax=Geofilum sp. OHC36d9 TaxID=3458413 RepID=UPI004033A066